MQAPAPHPQEPQRLAALRALRLLDSSAEPRFDALTRTACRLFGVPMALISLVDERRVWFKSRLGTAATEAPRETSFCGHAILGDGPFVVEDALEDPRFEGNPRVAGEPGFRFYAGAPLRSPEGLPYGTLCVLGLEPRAFPAEDRRALQDLALVAEAELRSAHSREQERLLAILETSPDFIGTADLEGHLKYHNRAALDLVGLPQDTDISTLTVADMHPPWASRLVFEEGIPAVLAGGIWKHDNALLHREGYEIPVSQVIMAHRDRDGAPEFLSTIMRDLREQREVESTLRQAEERYHLQAEEQARQSAFQLRELKAREGALEASERQFRDLVASVPGIVFQSRPLPEGQREFTFVSDYCRVILGLDPAKAMANPQWLEGMVLPEDRASLAQAVASARESNGATEWVGRMRRKPDGQIRWVRLQATPWQAADGSFRWNGLVMDLTERIDSELALRQSEERLALVLKGSNDAPWDWDLERGDLYYSPRWWHMLGYADNELHVDTDLWKLMTHPDDQSHVVAALDEALQGGGDSYEVEFRLRHKDGHFVPVLSRGFIQRNEAGLPIRISGTNMDLTERKSVEASLVASQARSQALLEAMPDLIFLVHRDGTHLEVHAHSEGGLRRPKAQILGQNMRDIYPPDIYEERMARIQRVLATGVPESYETRFQALGGLQDHESRVVPCGRDTVLVIARDITERKALERLKNDFISTVSHELRTPLTSIKGALGLMAGGVTGALPPQALDLSRMALENANRLARLIDDLLDLAKTESAELSLDLRVHDLRHLTDQALEGIAGFAQTHQVTLAPAWEAEAAPARVDGDRLIQVVLNLLSNAVKYSAAGARVEVRLRRLDHAWRLEVENHGPEIPEAFRARIFQKFAMADGSDTRSRGGTGLGLAISKALVERMGGTIDYRSGNGRTIFYVELPRAEETP